MALHLLILIGAVLIPAILAACAAELIRSAIAVLVFSIGLTVLLFQLNAPLAGVFELLVCAGLISVLFILTISLTRPLTAKAESAYKHTHYRRYLALPILMAVMAIILWFSHESWIGHLPVVKSQETASVGEVLWQTRGLDLIGQITVLLVGVYGVVVLFKRGKMNE